MEPKFIIKEGYITSQHDGEEHFISYNKLIMLYNLNPKDCTYNTVGVSYNWIELTPRYDGNYSLPLAIHENIERWNSFYYEKGYYKGIEDTIERFNRKSFLSRLKILFKK